MPNYLLAKDLILNVGDRFLSHVFPFESNVVNENYVTQVYYTVTVIFSRRCWYVQTLTVNIQIIGEIFNCM
jgi:hypothetical protein